MSSSWMLWIIQLIFIEETLVLYYLCKHDTNLRYLVAYNTNIEEHEQKGGFYSVDSPWIFIIWIKKKTILSTSPKSKCKGSNRRE